MTLHLGVPFGLLDPSSDTCWTRAGLQSQESTTVYAGELRKASSTVTTSTWGTLVGINGLVHEVFPPQLPAEQSQGVTQREEFNDFSFWHVQPPIIVDSDEDLESSPQPSGNATETGDLSEAAGQLAEVESLGAAGSMGESEQLEGYDSTDESGGDTPVRNDLMMTLGSPFPL